MREMDKSVKRIKADDKNAKIEIVNIEEENGICRVDYQIISSLDNRDLLRYLDNLVYCGLIL